jgi:phage shock protein C
MAILEQPEYAMAQRSGRVVLRRDTGNNPGGGVCAGIARYLDVDPIFVRGAFILLTLGYGFGLALYIVLYFMMPRAQAGENVGFAPGSSEVQKARLISLLSLSFLAVLSIAVAFVPRLDWAYVPPTVLAVVCLVTLAVWKLRR